MGRVLSGVQPTGNLHLGNYLGAIRNWVDLQDDHECLFCIVDLHALTTHPDPTQLRAWTREVAAAYIACGIDPKRSAVFPQSAVPEHSELNWLLSCQTPLGWLNRMTQFKEKAGKHKEQANLGLYAYPVLMAADILIYKTTHVPVGEDQKQHLELARDIAGAFNREYGVDYFTLPEPVILKAAARVMSLRDGTAKMSKTDPSDYSRIHLSDDEETIRLKIRKAKTDSDPIAGTLDEMKDRPEALNLIDLLAALRRQSPQDICTQYAGSTFAPFKNDLADALVETLTPIRSEMTHLLKDTDALDSILKEGVEKARSITTPHLHEIHQIMGLLRV